MIHAAFLIPLLPARGLRRPARSSAASSATRSPAGSRPAMVGGVVRRHGHRLRRRCSSRAPATASLHRDLVHLVLRRPAARRRRAARRPALDDDGRVRHRRERADPPLLDRLHGARRGLPEVLRLPQPVRLLDADARPRRQLPAHRSSAGRASASARTSSSPSGSSAPSAASAGQEGDDLQPHRRRRLPGRAVPDLRAHRQPRSTTTSSPASGTSRRPTSIGDRAAVVPRRGRQVRADPAVPLARRRDGGPDAGLGAHPRRDDGHRRRLPDVPDQPDPAPRARRRARHRLDRRRDGLRRRRRSAARRPTSKRCSPTRRSPSSATCSWPPAAAPTSRRSSSCSPTPSTRRCCSSAPAR